MLQNKETLSKRNKSIGKSAEAKVCFEVVVKIG